MVFIPISLLAIKLKNTCKTKQAWYKSGHEGSNDDSSNGGAGGAEQRSNGPPRPARNGRAYRSFGAGVAAGAERDCARGAQQHGAAGGGA